MSLDELDKPKTKEELAKEEKEREERKIKLTRILKGVGIVIRAFGKFFYKLGNGIVTSCDRSLAKPGNRKILKRMGNLPKKEKDEDSEKSEDVKNGGKDDGKEIVIKIPR